MNSTTEQLDALRGSSKRKRHDARTLAALTANPACVRRSILDAAGINKEKLAERVGSPTSIGRLSSIAIRRGNFFEESVKAEGGAEVLRLLRELLNLPTAEVAYQDLGPSDAEAAPGTIGNELTNDARYQLTKLALRSTAGSGPDAGTMFSSPMLRIMFGGVWVYLEPDLLAFRLGDTFHVIEIKSFPIIDGAADPGKVATALRQAAIYVIALENLMEDIGQPRSMVSPEVLLVCPLDFSNRPTAAVRDVRRELTVIRRQLSRMERIEKLLAPIPATASFDLEADTAGNPIRSAEQLSTDLGIIPARYSPDCLNHCEMAKYCRDEARGTTHALGRTVREELGGVESTKTVVALASGRMAPTPDLVQAAELLTLVYTMRMACLGGAL